MLQFDSVTKEYAGLRAVDGLSFQVQKGEIFALLGPNGAGKTTCVRMIMGLISPDQGHIHFHAVLRQGNQLDRKQLGYLPEERGLYQEATVLSTLLYLASLRGCRAETARNRALAWLERVELGDRAEDKVSSLSKGNQQKVQFIASILHAPTLVVLDEPFSGLDPINQERMCRWIQKLSDEGMTILLSAHQLQLIEQIADRILLLHRGQRRLCGSLEEIQSATAAGRRLQIVYDGPIDTGRLHAISGIQSLSSVEQNRLEVTLEDGAELNDIVTSLAAAGRLSGLQTLTPSLHDIFLQNFDSQESAS